MPTVLKISGLRVVIYPNDHRPAHVHVMGRDCEGIFDLHCPWGPPELRDNFGFKYAELNRIAESLAGDLTMLCSKWREFHVSH